MTTLEGPFQCFCKTEVLGAIDEPLFENLGFIGNFRGSLYFINLSFYKRFVVSYGPLYENK